MSDQARQDKLASNTIKLWHGLETSFQYVGDSANRVYKFIESGRKRYLRLTSSRDRAREQIEAELDFIAYLRRGGVSAMLPVPSTSGRFIEDVPATDGSLLACVFKEAEGETFRHDPARPDREHWMLRGRTLGQIHSLSKIYVPSSGFRRFVWDKDRTLLTVDEFLPKSERAFWREYDELREWLQDRDKSSQTFGLIHGDFGATNYRYKGDRLNIFDFDDCCYHWFAYDVVVSIYPHGWRREGLLLLDWLLDGYSEDMSLDVTLPEITMFCRWRQVYMFLTYARKWGFDRLSQQQSSWFARKRENIMRGYKWAT